MHMCRRFVFETSNPHRAGQNGAPSQSECCRLPSATAAHWLPCPHSHLALPGSAPLPSLQLQLPSAWYGMTHLEHDAAGRVRYPHVGPLLADAVHRWYAVAATGVVPEAGDAGRERFACKGMCVGPATIPSHVEILFPLHRPHSTLTWRLRLSADRGCCPCQHPTCPIPPCHVGAQYMQYTAIGVAHGYTVQAVHRNHWGGECSQVPL